MNGTNDKAGKAYWSSLWENSVLPSAVDPDDKRIGNYIVRRLHALFREIFSGNSLQGSGLLEIGCARSVWLPYFAKQFGFRVTGLDYSESGCRQSEAILVREGVAGEIICADFFSPPESLIERFNVVTSFGVAEHFADTTQCIAAFAKFLKPGGRMITAVPNMNGLIGVLQRLLDRSIYDIHVPLDVTALRDVHEKSGLEVMFCKYFISSGFGVLNTASLTGSGLSVRFKRRLNADLSRLSKFIGALEDRTGRLPAMRWAAPYVICLARKPESFNQRLKRDAGGFSL